MKKHLSLRCLVIVAATAINGAYLQAFDSATIFYHANVVAHVVFGVMLVIALIWAGLVAFTRKGDGPSYGRILLLLCTIGAIVMSATGLWLVHVGESRPYVRWVTSHEIAALAFLLTFALLAARRFPKTSFATASLAIVAVSILFPAAIAVYKKQFPAHVTLITNPPLPPKTADDEGAGKGSPYFPSSNFSRTGTILPGQHSPNTTRY